MKLPLIVALASFAVFSTAYAGENAHLIIKNDTSHTLVVEAISVDSGAKTGAKAHIKAGQATEALRSGWVTHYSSIFDDDFINSLYVIQDLGPDKLYYCGTVPNTKIKMDAQGNITVTITSCDSQQGLNYTKSGPIVS